MDTPPPPAGPPRRPSSVTRQGVAAVLDEVKHAVEAKLRARLLERRAQGRHELPDEEIETIARLAGMTAREAASDGVGQAFQLGVHRNATEEDHAAQTRPRPAFDGAVSDEDQRRNHK